MRPASSTTPIRPSAISSACCASGSTAIEPPRKAAQGLADHLNSVLNATVSDSRLSLIQLPYAENAFELTRLVERASRPLELRGTSAHLFVRQIIEVVGGHCQTESYGYRLQAAESVDSWLVRWEYLRDPPRSDYPYSRAHVHLNAAFFDNSWAAQLHIPTRRAPLELVLWHLIAEWGVSSKTDNWQDFMKESIVGFDERRTTD